MLFLKETRFEANHEMMSCKTFEKTIRLTKSLQKKVKRLKKRFYIFCKNSFFMLKSSAKLNIPCSITVQTCPNSNANFVNLSFKPFSKSTQQLHSTYWREEIDDSFTDFSPKSNFVSQTILWYHGIKCYLWNLIILK